MFNFKLSNRRKRKKIPMKKHLNNNKQNNAPNNIENNRQIELNKKLLEESIKVRRFWGAPAWIFFHCLSEKIDEKYYLENYITVFKLIKEIFNCIPCPMCRNHAIKKVDIHNNFKITDIDTKEKLKMFFFSFHNEVNKRVGVDICSIRILDEYKDYNMEIVYKNFLKFFFKSYYSGTGLNRSHIRNSTKINIKKYFNKNWNILFK